MLYTVVYKNRLNQHTTAVLGVPAGQERTLDTVREKLESNGCQHIATHPALLGETSTAPETILLHPLPIVDFLAALE